MAMIKFKYYILYTLLLLKWQMERILIFLLSKNYLKNITQPLH